MNEDGYLPGEAKQARKSEASIPLGQVYLPHSCDEWCIGDEDNIQALIADLQRLLVLMVGARAEMGEPETEDRRIVYGATCTWWDSIDKSSVLDAGTGVLLPCCPSCHGMLCEVASIETWIDQIEAYTANGHPHYRSMMVWVRGKCFKTMYDAELAWRAHAVRQMKEVYVQPRSL